VTISLSDFVEEVIADRNGLTEEQLQQGIDLWDEAIESMSQAAQLMIAPAVYCSELDLPQGSYWVEVLAAALDAVPDINGTDHLRLLQQEIEECGLAPVPFSA